MRYGGCGTRCCTDVVCRGRVALYGADIARGGYGTVHRAARFFALDVVRFAIFKVKKPIDNAKKLHYTKNNKYDFILIRRQTQWLKKKL